MDEAVHRKTKSGSDYADMNELKNVSRLGGNDYGRTSGTFSIARPPATAGDAWREKF